MRKYTKNFLIACVLCLIAGASSRLMVLGVCSVWERDAKYGPKADAVVARPLASIERMQHSTVTVATMTPFGPGYGSGVVISSNGVILTARHVADGASDIEILNFDGSVDKVKYVVIDEKSDCAVLFTGVQRDTYSRLAQRDPVVGETVTVCGSPFGLEYCNYVTRGIVSKYPEVNQFFSPSALFMFDAAINPGNSGGPVFDSDGDVIGLAIGSDTRGAGLYYATPICDVVNLLQVLDPVY